jgi:hypothetical protein
MASAVARPMPWPAAVTKQSLPANLPAIGLSSAFVFQSAFAAGHLALGRWLSGWVRFWGLSTKALRSRICEGMRTGFNRISLDKLRVP